MKLALAQIATTSQNIQLNTEKMISEINSAASTGCDLVVFPEMSDVGYDMQFISSNAQRWTEKGTFQLLSKHAKKAKINVIAGLSEREDNGIYNSLAVIGRNGELLEKYRKTHLITAAPLHEERYIKPGSSLKRVEIEGYSIALNICYELRFPEISRLHALAGADILLYSAAWPLLRLPHWQALLKARAIENQCFVAGVSRLGTDANVQFSGSSMIFDPYGVKLASASEIHESLVIATLEKQKIADVRENIRVYQDRREELY